MREIKFRGFDGMEWIYGSAVQYEKETDTWYMIENGSPDDDWLMVGYVGQYIGLRDSRKQEIYEGDIVQGKNRLFENQVTRQEVTFLNGCFMIGNWNSHEYFNKHQEIEVVGDAYEID